MRYIWKRGMGILFNKIFHRYFDGARSLHASFIDYGKKGEQNKIQDSGT